MDINPLTKVQFTPPPSLSGAGEFVPDVAYISVPSGADFADLADAVFKGIIEEINFGQFCKRVAMVERDPAIMNGISARRVQALKTLQELSKSKVEYLAKYKIRVRSEEVIQKVITFLIKEVKSITEEAGQPDFFNTVCKELDLRLPRINDLVSSEVESKFPEQE